MNIDTGIFSFNTGTSSNFLANASGSSIFQLIAIFLLSYVSFVAGIYYTKLVALYSSYCQKESQKLASLETDIDDVEQLTDDQKETLMSAPENVPKHVAVIMDGNRRFGREKYSDPLQGHWDGGQRLVDFIEWCMDDGVKMVTVYAFSTENWNRDASEVNTLMIIFAKYAERFKKEALARNVKVNILSTEFEKLSDSVKESVKELQSATEDCTGFVVNICLSYGSRGDIISSCKKIGASLIDRSISLSDITEELFSRHLLTSTCPEPDILIRTSGEYRLSNFLLWQLAYTELFFIDKLWPQITKVDLRMIFHQYNSRNRRFGV